MRSERAGGLTFLGSRDARAAVEGLHGSRIGGYK